MTIWLSALHWVRLNNPATTRSCTCRKSDEVLLRTGPTRAVIASALLLMAWHDLVLQSALHLVIFPAHVVPPHTSRHEEGPALARARPGDLESEELSRLALVNTPPPGTQQMRSSSTCIAEDERLDPLCHTPQVGLRGACKCWHVSDP